MSAREVTREEAADVAISDLHNSWEQRLARTVVVLYDERERLRQAITDAERAILGGDTPSATDRMLHAALAPLWQAVMSR